MSSFFALRACESPPSVIALITCEVCGTRYFNHTLTSEQLCKFYAGYRDETYVQQRQQFEPGYTAIFNASLGGDAGMTERRAVLAHALAVHCPNVEFASVLDHGGDRGQMLRDLKASRKAVYDVSQAAPEPGVESLSASQVHAAPWTLILSCHVLEHLISPDDYLHDLIACGDEASIFFFEIPYEPAKTTFLNQTYFQKVWLKFLIRNSKLLTKFDHLSMGLLNWTGYILPGCFYALREHLTFFTIDGIKSMLKRHGMNVLTAELASTGHIVVLARKSN